MAAECKLPAAPLRRVMENPLRPPAANPQAEVDLQDLLQSFAAVLAEDDPVRRKIKLLREAERLGLGADTYGGLLELSTRRKAPRWLLEHYTERVVEWLQNLSLFSLLEYVGRLAILLAIVSFFVELPERRKQRDYEAWNTVDQARGRRYSHARIDALERLNKDCLSLEGLDAAGGQLAGLRLDRCYRLPGGSLFGPLLPRLFRRQGADLTGARLDGADLARARLPGAELSHARLSRARLAGAALGAATLAGADLRGADLFRADLQGASLRAADLSGANLNEADLRGADLWNARLAGARLTGADLRGAVLAYAGLDKVNLARADLRGAELFHARLGGALLRKARLDGRTRFEGTEVRGADLRQAFLPSREQLRSARGLERALLDPPAPAAAGARPFTLGVIVDDEQHFFREILDGAREAAGRDARLVVRMASAGAGSELEREAAIVREYPRPRCRRHRHGAAGRASLGAGRPRRLRGGRGRCLLRPLPRRGPRRAPGRGQLRERPALPSVRKAGVRWPAGCSTSRGPCATARGWASSRPATSRAATGAWRASAPGSTRRGSPGARRRSAPRASGSRAPGPRPSCCASIRRSSSSGPPTSAAPSTWSAPCGRAGGRGGCGCGEPTSARVWPSMLLAPDEVLQAVHRADAPRDGLPGRRGGPRGAARAHGAVPHRARAARALPAREQGGAAVRGGAPAATQSGLWRNTVETAARYRPFPSVRKPQGDPFDVA